MIRLEKHCEFERDSDAISRDKLRAEATRKLLRKIIKTTREDARAFEAELTRDFPRDPGDEPCSS